MGPEAAFLRAALLGLVVSAALKMAGRGRRAGEERGSPSRETKAHDSATAAIQEGNDYTCAREWGWKVPGEDLVIPWVWSGAGQSRVTPRFSCDWMFGGPADR